MFIHDLGQQKLFLHIIKLDGKFVKFNGFLAPNFTKPKQIFRSMLVKFLLNYLRPTLKHNNNHKYYFSLIPKLILIVGIIFKIH